MRIDIALNKETKPYLVVNKLLVLDRNTWNHTVQMIFLDRNIWYYIHDKNDYKQKKMQWNI